MIRIVINHDRVGIPIPVGHVGIVERRDREVVSAEPETLTGAALQVERPAKTEREPAVFEWAILVKTAVIAREVMTHPMSLVGNIRSAGMSFGLAEIAWLAVLFAVRRGGRTVRRH